MPDDWRAIHTSHALHDGVSIGCYNGTPRSEWACADTSTPGFGIAVILAGRFRFGFDEGRPMEVGPGSVIVHSTDTPLTGWDEFPGGEATRAVDVRFADTELRHLWQGIASAAPRGVFSADSSVRERDAYLMTVPLWNTLAGIAEDLLEWAPVRDNVASVYLRAKAWEAAAVTLRHLGGRRDGVLPYPGDRRRLIDAFSLIQSAFAESLSVARIAQSAGISEQRLQAGFLALYGMTVHACLHRTRMEAAERLLSNGCPVTQTAFDVGFSSISHFIKAFKAHSGLTPSGWRNRR
jgi:AraC-like DNA-binding protein